MWRRAERLTCAVDWGAAYSFGGSANGVHRLTQLGFQCSLFGRVAPSFVAPTSAMDVLITDSDAPEDTLEKLRDSGVEVVLV